VAIALAFQARTQTTWVRVPPFAPDFLLEEVIKMGWSGYGLYDGDETQTCHIGFIKIAIPSLSEDIIFNFLKFRKTSIPNNLLASFKKGTPFILKKMKAPNIIQWNEDNAIDWQMLLALFVDNNLIVPHKVLVYGMLACHYLLGEHSKDFNEPRKRRAAIKRFMKKVDSEFCSVRARKDIMHIINQ
jgi:hypothetical protein